MNSRYLEKHVVNCGKKKTFLCRVCNKYFKTEAYYIRHISYYNGPPKKPTCERCGTPFTCKNVLTKHIALHD